MHNAKTSKQPPHKHLYNTSDTIKRQQSAEQSLATSIRLSVERQMLAALLCSHGDPRCGLAPSAPRSMPDGSFLARAASVLSVRAQVTSRLRIICSRRASVVCGVSRRHDRTGPSPFSRSRRRKGWGEARGTGPGHSRRGCVPVLPRRWRSAPARQPPARVYFGSSVGRADVRFVRLLDLPSQKAPGQGAGAERQRQRRGGAARTHDASGPRQRRAPRPGPSVGGSG